MPLKLSVPDLGKEATRTSIPTREVHALGRDDVHRHVVFFALYIESLETGVLGVRARRTYVHAAFEDFRQKPAPLPRLVHQHDRPRSPFPKLQ
jgi:hypothetical protein